MPPSKKSSKNDNLPDPRFLVVGQVLRPHGVRGELRVQILSGRPDRFLSLEKVALARDPEKTDKLTEYEVERARLHQTFAILKLAKVDERNDAELLREQYIMIPIEQAVPLEEGEYYFYQLIGLEMVTEAGESIGKVTDILETGANEIYVVQSPRYGEVLIPAIESVIKEILPEEGKIIITPMEGLLPD